MSNAIKQTSLTVTGRISRFLSGPSADGYAIAKITTRNGSLTIKGRNVINAFKVGEAIRVSGEEMTHPRFGRQLQATEAWLVDEGAEGLVRWLAEAGIAERVPARAADRGRVVRPQHMPSSFHLKDMTARTAGTAFPVSARINLANWSALA